MVFEIAVDPARHEAGPGSAAGHRSAIPTQCRLGLAGGTAPPRIPFSSKGHSLASIPQGRASAFEAGHGALLRVSSLFGCGCRIGDQTAPACTLNTPSRRLGQAAHHGAKCWMAVFEVAPPRRRPVDAGVRPRASGSSSWDQAAWL